MNNQELPFYDTRQYKLTLSLALSLFFYFFMVFFLPFGVDNYDPDFTYEPDFFREMFHFIIPLFSFTLINEFLIRPLFFRNVSIKKIILWNLWTLTLLGTIVFFTYNILGNWHDFYE